MVRMFFTLSQSPVAQGHCQAGALRPGTEVTLQDLASTLTDVLQPRF